jgi:hypothetical protein
MPFIKKFMKVRVKKKHLGIFQDATSYKQYNLILKLGKTSLII